MNWNPFQRNHKPARIIGKWPQYRQNAGQTNSVSYGTDATGKEYEKIVYVPYFTGGGIQIHALDAETGNMK
ncbi:MAG: hypothetical protein J4473_04940 [Candidatus Aenigmarchaeota archaeon]|nr:hypothetical protein [Candidatus Aenigmarchaeota archaeon]